MTTQEITSYRLQAQDGHYLTQAADVPLTERVVAREVFTPDTAAWTEITADEAKDIEAQQEALQDNTDKADEQHE